MVGGRVEVQLFRLAPRQAAGLPHSLTPAGAEPVARGRVGGDGAFRLPAPEAGMWRVVVRAPGRTPRELLLAPLLEAAELPPLSLTPDAGLTVRAVDEEGKPLAGVRVTVLPWSPRGELPAGRWRPAPRLAVTGEDGTATLPRNGVEPLALTAVKEGFLPIEPIPVPPAAVVLELRRSEAETGAERERAEVEVTLTGRVLTASGRRSLAGALVWPAADPGAFVVTGPKGRFRLPLPPADGAPVPIRAAARGHWVAEAMIEGKLHPETVEQDLVLQRAKALAGRVVDETGALLPGVEIEATPLGPSATGFAFTRSGPEGRFRLLLAPERVYRLMARREGYPPLRLEVAVGPTGQPAEPLRLTLQRGVTAFGRVVDEAGEPVPGAQVRLWPSPPELELDTSLEPTPEGVHSTLTDDAGRFQLPGLSPDEHDLEIRARGFAPALVPGVTASGEDGRGLGTVVLAPAAVVVGRVTDADGRPLAGAVVDHRPSALDEAAIRRLRERPPEPVTSDGEGLFTIADRRPGERLDLVVRRPGYTQASLREVAVPPERPLLFALRPTAALQGRVVDPEGVPVAAARVFLRHRRGVGRETLADEDGLFALEGIEPGSLRLVAVAEGFQAAELGLQIAPGEGMEDLEVELSPAATVEGRVLAAGGEPVAGAAVRGAGEADPALPGTPDGVVTDREGRFRLTGLGPGPRILEARHPEHPSVTERARLYVGVNRVDLRLPPGQSVSGRVVDPEGVGLAAVSLELQSTTSAQVRHGRSAEDGSFTLEGVGEGRYRLRASRGGHAEVELEEEIEVAGAPVAGIELVMTSGLALAGVVRGLELDQLATVQVEADGPHGARRRSRVDYQGRYHLARLAPGRWTVTASEGQSGRTVRDEILLEAGMREIELDLGFPEGLSLAGSVRLDGSPLAGAQVVARGEDGTVAATARSDAEGRFTLQGLAAGPYLVEVRHFETGAEASRVAELPAQTELPFELALQRLEGRVVDALDGRPLSGASVGLRRWVGSGWHGARTTRTDSRGAFSLRLEPGRWLLELHRQGYAPADRELQLEVGGEGEALVIPLYPSPL